MGFDARDLSRLGGAPVDAEAHGEEEDHCEEAHAGHAWRKIHPTERATDGSRFNKGKQKRCHVVQGSKLNPKGKFCGRWQ